jgi:hypothetical protein
MCACGPCAAQLAAVDREIAVLELSAAQLSDNIADKVGSRLGGYVS